MRKMEFFMIALTFLLLKNALCENAWEIQNKISGRMREKVEKTSIVGYYKSKMTNDEIKNEKRRLENVCQCEVENLESVGAFILTYNNPYQRAAVYLNLDPSKEVGVEDQIVTIVNKEIPTDPDFGQQWPLQDLANNADINAAEGWKEFVSDPNGPLVVVAVIDTGVSYSHPDLKDVMWRNPGEVPDNGQDDDGNGIIDDVYGADFANDDGDPDDDNSHGTHCAGVIGANENNGKGIAGVASFTQGKVKIMAVKVFDTSGSSTVSAALKGINYAIYNGATISSNSWGIYMNNSTRALFKLYLQNNPKHLFVAASGNSGELLDESNKKALCAFKEPNVLCVGSSTRQGTISWFSNYGKDYVHVFAPGSDIYSTTPRFPIPGDHLELSYETSFKCDSGTSMACPHVAGFAALIRAMRPELTAGQVREVIEANVQKKEAFKKYVSSGGIIDMGKTIRALKEKINLDEGYPGEWGPRQYCSSPHFVNKMELKIQSNEGERDHTALNAIKLTCADGHTITSSQHIWGWWRGVKACSPGSFINKAKIRREDLIIGDGNDNTGGNGIRFECTDGNQHEPGDGFEGSWSQWGSCISGFAVMGIQTRVQLIQGAGDNTALNDVRFFCAKIPHGNKK